MRAARSPVRPVACTNCGFNISGLPDAAACPECGAAITPVARSQVFVRLERSTLTALRQRVGILIVGHALGGAALIMLGTARMTLSIPASLIATGLGVAGALVCYFGGTGIRRLMATHLNETLQNGQESSPGLEGRWLGLGAAMLVGGWLLIAANMWVIRHTHPGPWESVLADCSFLVSLTSYWLVNARFLAFLADACPRDNPSWEPAPLSGVLWTGLWIGAPAWIALHGGCVVGLLVPVWLLVTSVWLILAHVFVYRECRLLETA